MGLSATGLFVLFTSASLLPGAPVAAPVAHAPLTGQWAGPQVQMTAGDTGAKIEFSCASATIDAAVYPDDAGNFKASGRHSSFPVGPTPADVPPASSPVQFTGHVAGDILHLNLHRQGVQDESYRLERGRRTKLIRCQ